MIDPATSIPETITRRFYRIVKTNPPTLADFISNAAKGRPILDNARPEARRLWDGLSVYATEAQARRHARVSPMLGAFLAELVITPDTVVRIERTLGSGLYTIWGDPALLLSCIARVAPVRQAAMETEQ
jgi:hypothetical protein